MVDEIWLPIPGFGGAYSASSLGRVRSHDRHVANRPTGSTRLARGRILKARPVTGGYLQVSLYDETRRVPMKVAAAVAAAFIGPRPPGLDVCHNDGCVTNDAASNLRYGTRKENMADCLLHGTRARGEKQGGAKLTTAKVLAIRADARTYEKIAAEFGISFQHVGAIKHRKAWKHV